MRTGESSLQAVTLPLSPSGLGESNWNPAGLPVPVRRGLPGFRWTAEGSGQPNSTADPRAAFDAMRNAAQLNAGSRRLCPESARPTCWLHSTPARNCGEVARRFLVSAAP